MVCVMNGEIVFGTVKMDYSAEFAQRKTLSIKVTPAGAVSIIAPEGATKEQIEEKLHKKAPWVLKQKRFFESFGVHTPSKKYVSGESHYYLGRQYILRVIEGKPGNAKYKGRCFEVVCSPKSKAKQLMKEWYRERARAKFIEMVEIIAEKFEKYGVTFSSLYIQEMENRWGSCTPKGKIILNTELIKAPKMCIEYVITHEFCHLVHRDHTKAFYDLLEMEMPDWKRWKHKLEQFMF